MNKKYILAVITLFVLFGMIAVNPNINVHAEEEKDATSSHSSSMESEEEDSDEEESEDSSEGESYVDDEEVVPPMPVIPKLPGDLDKKTGKAALKANAVVNNTRKLNIATMNKLPGMVAFPNYNRVMSLSGSTNSIVRLQKQLDQIINLNEKINQTNQKDISSLQKAVSVSKIHQKILRDLAEVDEKTSNVTLEDADEILRQEKIRLIKEHAEESLKALEELEEESKEEEEESNSSEDEGESSSKQDNQDES